MHGTTILVAEDDDDIRDAISDALKSDGYDVAPAANGEEVMDYLRGPNAVPAVILLDLMMPLLNGWDCLRMIRSGRCRAVPVVVITAVAGERPAGVEAFLRKPFGMGELRAVVGRLSALMAV